MLAGVCVFGFPVVEAFLQFGGQVLTELISIQSCMIFRLVMNSERFRHACTCLDCSKWYKVQISWFSLGFRDSVTTWKEIWPPPPSITELLVHLSKIWWPSLEPKIDLLITGAPAEEPIWSCFKKWIRKRFCFAQDLKFSGKTFFHPKLKVDL